MLHRVINVLALSVMYAYSKLCDVMIFYGNL